MNTATKLALGIGAGILIYWLWEKAHPCGCNAPTAAPATPGGSAQQIAVGSALTASAQASSDLGGGFVTAGLLPPAAPSLGHVPIWGYSPLTPKIINSTLAASVAPIQPQPAPASNLIGPTVLGGVIVPPQPAKPLPAPDPG